VGNSISELPAHCFSLLGGLGGKWGREILYLGSGHLITYIRQLSARLGGCGGMDCNRWVWMTMFKLGRYFHLGMYLFSGLALAVGHGF
jgi:hypothetical protein